MKKYSFKLQSVLDYKEQIEDSIKNKLSNHIYKQSCEKKALQDCLNERKLLIEEFQKNKHKHTNIFNVIVYYDYLNELTNKIEKHTIKIKEMQEVIDSIKEELKIAMMEKQTLIKLEEKHFNLYKDEIKGEEQKLNDQLNSYRYYQKRQNNDIFEV